MGFSQTNVLNDSNLYTLWKTYNVCSVTHNCVDYIIIMLFALRAQWSSIAGRWMCCDAHSANSFAKKPQYSFQLCKSFYSHQITIAANKRLALNIQLNRDGWCLAVWHHFFLFRQRLQFANCIISLWPSNTLTATTHSKERIKNEERQYQDETS